MRNPIKGERRSMSALVVVLATIAYAGPAAANDEATVWLAAARHVLENENAGKAQSRPLTILARSSFPGGKIATSSLDDSASKGFCDLSAQEAASILEQLRQANSSPAATRDVFAKRKQFALTDARSGKGDYVGLSRVAFSHDGRTAYLNVDISGLSGSIVRMKRQDNAWVWDEECSGWVSW